MTNWRITKDKPLIGPPLGGAISFTAQATGYLYKATGLAEPASLIAALALGAATGWLIEKAVTKVLSPLPIIETNAN